MFLTITFVKIEHRVADESSSKSTQNLPTTPKRWWRTKCPITSHNQLILSVTSNRMPPGRRHFSSIVCWYCVQFKLTLTLHSFILQEYFNKYCLCKCLQFDTGIVYITALALMCIYTFKYIFCNIVFCGLKWLYLLLC